MIYTDTGAASPESPERCCPICGCFYRGVCGCPRERELPGPDEAAAIAAALEYAACGALWSKPARGVTE